ncbi:MAG: glycosyltransferase [Planctomycetota bacterium]
MSASPAPVRSISILMPTWQGMEFLARVFDALAAQRCALPFDVHVVDSGSTDGTYEYLQQRAAAFPVPLHLRRIHQVEFDHGDTRNSLAARSTGDLLVFLTQDAIPSGADWLARLAANFEDPSVGAAYCRNVPRPDARPLTKLHSAGDPGYASERRVVRLPAAEVYAALGPHERRLLYNFNDVASAVRREVWERHPFPRTWFGEDVLMARALLEAGWAIVYEADAVVEHSHDYDAAETRKRAAIDARFSAEWLGRICVGSAQDAEVLTERLTAQDEAALAASGDAQGLTPGARAALVEESRALRRAAFQGLYEGGRSERRYPATRVRAETRLRILYVVHGFPPETWAGTEVYTLNLAREMQARGHTVTILARSPGQGDEPDFTLIEDELQGLRVLRMTHRLAHADMRESYAQPKAEAAFRRVLAAERPDVVHFQHLIHTSIGLVEIARAAGIATVVHCHDFWALCSRVQMIRPDGKLCGSNMGSGCYLCVKETALEHVERAHRLDGVLGAPRAIARLVGLAGQKGQRRAREYADVRAREVAVPAAYAAADLCISPSRFLRDMLLASGLFEAHRFLYSENGMRTDHVRALEKRPAPGGRVRFGFVGSLVWYKGGETLVRAMNRLAGRNATLHVWGAFEPEKDPHHRALRDLANAGNVEFRGRFDNSKLAEVYAEIDVLVVPSLWYENAPVTIREAFMTGTPVVTSGIGGMAESVQDGVDGLHFAVGDHADLARKLARFLDEPGLVHALSQRFPDVKSIADDARDMEYRYRALVCIERTDAPGLVGELLDVAGADATAVRGAADRQGAATLLLRPGASADYDLGRPTAGAYEVEVEQVALGVERDLALAGSLAIDGRPVGVLAVVTSRGADQTLRGRIALALDDGAQTLTLTAVHPDCASAHLRVLRVRLRRLASTPPVTSPSPCPSSAKAVQEPTLSEGARP